MDALAEPDSSGRVRTAATIARVRSFLSGALADALESGLVAVNVARGVRLPKGASAGKAGQVDIFTPTELARFLSAADADPLGPLFRLTGATGLRRGEVAGLSWGDIDLDEGRITVRRSLTQRGGQLRWSSPKTRRGERIVPLDRSTVDLLRQHRKAQLQRRMQWGDARWNADELVFVRADGSAVRPDTITHAFARIAEGCGLNGRHFHCLRHSHASHALAAGVPVKVVSDRLGHSTTALTENVYQHVTADVAAQAAELIAALTRAAAATGGSKSGSSGPSSG